MDPNYKITIYCLSYAGGSSLFYNDWKKDINPNIEIVPLEIPGRGIRYEETFFHSIAQIVEDLLNQIKGNLNRPYAIFGHSMGAILSYELAHLIKENCMNQPLHLFLSSYLPPDNRYETGLSSKLDDLALKDKIISMGGTSLDVINNNCLWDIFKRIILADFYVLENYHYQEYANNLDIDFTIIYGDSDSEIDKENLLKWSQYTTGKCSFIEFKGGHFYLFQHKLKLLKIISNTLLSN